MVEAYAEGQANIWLRLQAEKTLKMRMSTSQFFVQPLHLCPLASVRGTPYVLL